MPLPIDLKSVTFSEKTPFHSASLDSLDANAIEYSDFYYNYLYQNRPCIIKNVTNTWPCQKLWVPNGIPDIAYLEAHYGDSIIPVADCDEKYYDSQAKCTMTLHNYAEYWKENQDSKLSFRGKCLYLKDWHFMKEFPDEKIYKLPIIFASDWLNEYLLRDPNVDDDYRFVYMGPKGSWTPLHADVFSSFSWSVNICGKKKWAFFPPGHEIGLRDNFGVLAYSLDSEGLNDKKRYPNYNDSVKPFTLIQDVGDAVFVPSRWHHQVWNIEDTISINHNWINASNIKIVWEDLFKKMLQVEKEIEDCKDMCNWHDHCQLLLKSDYGIDAPEFCKFLLYIAQVRLECLSSATILKTNLSHYTFGRNQILFDLISLQIVLNEMLKAELSVLSIYEKQMQSVIESITMWK